MVIHRLPLPAIALVVCDRTCWESTAKVGSDNKSWLGDHSKKGLLTLLVLSVTSWCGCSLSFAKRDNDWWQDLPLLLPSADCQKFHCHLPLTFAAVLQLPPTILDNYSRNFQRTQKESGLEQRGEQQHGWENFTHLVSSSLPQCHHLTPLRHRRPSNAAALSTLAAHGCAATNALTSLSLPPHCGHPNSTILTWSLP